MKPYEQPKLKKLGLLRLVTKQSGGYVPPDPPPDPPSTPPPGTPHWPHWPPHWPPHHHVPTIKELPPPPPPHLCPPTITPNEAGGVVDP